MTVTSLKLTGCAPSAQGQTARLNSRQAKELASRAIRTWPQETLFDATSVLRQHPALRRHKSALLDVVYEEYCQRVDNGSLVSASAFVKRFPSIQESLCRLLEAHAALSLEAGNLAQLAAPPIPWPTSGEQFLEFQLLEELGRGAFSRVFLAAEPALGGRLVVVKVCRRGNIEADTLGQLLHPQIVPVYSVRSADDRGLTAICMPFLSRATLQDVLDFVHAQGGPPRGFAEVLSAIEAIHAGDEAPPAGRRPASSGTYVEGILRLAIQIADAMAYTHGRGVVHSDIKPSNMLVTSEGNCLLFDFNLAALPGRDASCGGTIPYMAPEQLRQLLSRGPRTSVEPRTDLFSFGVAFYQLLCGEHPFGQLPPGAAPREVADCLLKRQAAGPRPLHVEHQGIDPALAQVIQRCLAYEPSQRAEDARWLAAALRRSSAWPRRLHRSARLHRRSLLAGGCASGLVFLAGGYRWATAEPWALRQLRQGESALQRGDWDAAAAAFSRVIDAQRQCLAAYFGRGLAHLRARRLGPAYDDFHHLHARAPEGAVACCLGDCLTRMGVAENHPKKFIYAMTQYEEARSRQFQNLASLNNLGFCHLNAAKMAKHLDRAEEALRCAERLHGGDQERAIVYLNLASIDRKRAVHEGGVPLLANIDSALRLNPTLREAQVEAAILFAMAAAAAPKDTPQRQESLERALHHCQTSIEMGVAAEELEAQIAPYAAGLRSGEGRDWLQPTPAAARPVALDQGVRILDSFDARELSLPSFES
jgi:serine/threonine protein kinase